MSSTSQHSYTFPTSPLTHPWHPNWLKVAASPLLGLLLPLLLLHLPLLPKQLLLLPPFPSVTPWLQPGVGKRSGSGCVESPRNGELGVARDRGQEQQVGGGRARASVLSTARSSPSGRARSWGPRRRSSKSCLWRGSVGGKPLAQRSGGQGLCPCGKGRQGLRPSRSRRGALPGC